MALSFGDNIFNQSDVRENVSNTPATSPAWNLDLVSYKSQLSISSGEDFFISSDGKKLLFCSVNGLINEWDLVIPWNISSGVVNQTLDVSAYIAAPMGLTFSPSGLYMFISGTAANELISYTLTTAFDLSTATYAGAKSLLGGTNASRGLYFRKDGMRLYNIDGTADTINEYYLTTPWSIGGATLLHQLAITADDNEPYALSFSRDGSHVFYGGTEEDTIYKRTLLVPWNVKDAPAYVQEFEVIPGLSVKGMFFSPNGLNLYINNGSTIYQFSLEVWR